MPRNLDKEDEQPKAKASAAKSTPKPKKVENKRHVAKRVTKKSEVGDATVRASVKPSKNEPGPEPGGKGKTTDTRGAKTRGSKDDIVAPATAEELAEQPTAAQVAERQPIRQSDLPIPTENHKIDGETIEVGAIPSRVDPVEIKPSKRDTLAKDRARTEGLAIAADAPVQRGIGGDILEGKVGETRFQVDEKTGDLTVKGGFDG